uniref:Uncharacterized protein n=1 Tax=Arundo donax TaxID=35708 RepID=A0A0A9GZ25_ARUDO
MELDWFFILSAYLFTKWLSCFASNSLSNFLLFLLQLQIASKFLLCSHRLSWMSFVAFSIAHMIQKALGYLTNFLLEMGWLRYSCRHAKASRKPTGLNCVD